MTADRSHRLSVVYSVVVGVILATLASVWISALHKNLRLANARASLVKSIQNGDFAGTLSAVNIIDPLGRGTVGEWFAIKPGKPRRTWMPEDLSHPGEPGMSWLLERWRQLGHTKGGEEILEFHFAADPNAAIAEAVTHFEWLRHRNQSEFTAKFFETWLRRELEAAEADPPPSRNVRLASLVVQDRDLALLALRVHGEKRRSIDLPADLIAFTARADRLGDPAAFESLLKAVGMMDPVETFVAAEIPFEWGDREDFTWIEYFALTLLNQNLSQMQGLKDWLAKGPYASAGPEMPGVFFLNKLVERSTSTDYPEIDPTRCAAALATLNKLPEETKGTCAKLLNRYIASFSGHPDLREWVWTHHREAWESERREYLALKEIDRYQGTVWNPKPLHHWVWSALKHGQTGPTAEAVHHLWSLRMDEMRKNPRPITEENSGHVHPFAYLDLHYRTIAPDSLAPEALGLFLALGRNPATPPTGKFPTIRALSHGGGGWENNYDKIKPFWKTASLEELDRWLTELGGRFIDDPVRFLILDSLLEEYQPISKTLADPASMARFQKIAVANQSPGGWLSKDFAALAPPNWFRYSSDRAPFLAAGGVLFDTGQARQYLSDTRAPLGARISHALGIFEWHESRSADLISLDPAFLDTIVSLALEFARAIGAGTWDPCTISDRTWERIADVWLGETRPLGGAELAGKRAEARGILIAHLEKFTGQILGATPKAPAKTDFEPNPLYRAIPVFAAYAKLLRHDGRTAELAAFWKEIEPRYHNPRQVVPWITQSANLAGRAADKLTAEPLAKTFTVSGWDAFYSEWEKLGGGELAGTVSEMTEYLDIGPWFALVDCGADRFTGNPHSAPEHRFTALFPAGFNVNTNTKTPEQRVEIFLNEIAAAKPSPFNQAAFSLILPRVFTRFLSPLPFSRAFGPALTRERLATLPPAIREELVWSYGRKGRLPEARHLAALKDVSIPLAERWAAANFFTTIATDFGGRLSISPADWMPAERELVEISADILTKAVAARLPVWDIANRTLNPSSYDYRSSQRELVVERISQLLAFDAALSNRGRDLVRPEIVQGLIDQCPEPHLLLRNLYSIAIAVQERDAALSVYRRAVEIAEARADMFHGYINDQMIFEDRAAWLLRGQFTNELADLFIKEWPGSGGIHLVRTAQSSENPVISSVYSALAEDPDLQMLARCFFEPRASSVAPFIGPSPSSSSSGLIAEFLAHPFCDLETERICLDLLPLHPGQARLVAEYVDRRLEGENWKKTLTLDAPDFRRVWPFWAKRLQILALDGDFRTLREMLPEKKWFLSRGVRFDSIQEKNSLPKVGELTWMGFYLAFGQILSNQDNEWTDELSETITSFVSVRPASKLDAWHPRDHLNDRRPDNPWHHRRAAAQELVFLSFAAALAATIDLADDAWLAKMPAFGVLPKPSIGRDTDSSVNLSGNAFAMAVSRRAAGLPEEKRIRFLIRAFETTALTHDLRINNLPLSSLAADAHISGLTSDDLIAITRHRHEADPDAPLKMADLGIVLANAGRNAEALPLLEKALATFDPKIPSRDRYLVDRALRLARTGPILPRPK